MFVIKKYSGLSNNIVLSNLRDKLQLSSIREFGEPIRNQLNTNTKHNISSHHLLCVTHEGENFKATHTVVNFIGYYQSCSNILIKLWLVRYKLFYDQVKQIQVIHNCIHVFQKDLTSQRCIIVHIQTFTPWCLRLIHFLWCAGRRSRLAVFFTRNESWGHPTKLPITKSTKLYKQTHWFVMVTIEGQSPENVTGHTHIAKWHAPMQHPN
jgi:hypothetical protein